MDDAETQVMPELINTQAAVTLAASLEPGAGPSLEQLRSGYHGDEGPGLNKSVLMINGPRLLRVPAKQTYEKESCAKPSQPLQVELGCNDKVTEYHKN
jgi:hypothetical protein